VHLKSPTFSFSPSVKVAAVYRVGLIQLIKFLVVELTHTYLNSKFDMCVTFMVNYFFRER
jgi:hypothetical protein